MSKWTSKTLQKLILVQHQSTSLEAIEALRAFAQRIAADEAAVSVAWRCDWPEWHQYHDFSDPVPETWDDEPTTITPLFDHPPSQPPIDLAAIRETESRLAAANALLRECVKYHGVSLPSMPPQDAWTYHRMNDRISEYLRTGNTESP